MAKQTKYQEHVRAAREWLGRAEDSLAQDDQIRGDLDVMLAQAELQRAQEMEGGIARRRWFRRSLPVGAAALVAGCLWGMWPAAPPPLVERAPLSRAAETETKFSSAVSAAATAPTAIDIPAVPPVTAEGSSAAQEPPQGEAALREGTADVEPLPQIQPTVRVPSRDMQKLMSAAGQSLRAQ